MDTKLAIWSTLLPACKRDPLRKDGTVDEVMFLAQYAEPSNETYTHVLISCVQFSVTAAVTLATIHRPYSSLVPCAAELTTQAFLPSTPPVPPPKAGRGTHTARALRATEMHTRLLAIPCAMERHSVATLSMSAHLGTAGISACANLLEDHALSIARDRVRLSIGYLNTMGSIWSLGKAMAKELRYVARSVLSNTRHSVAIATEPDPTEEIDIPRDDLMWPINPSAQIDIFSGLVLPMQSDANIGYSSSSSSDLPWR
jgi:hypothetical protein